MRQLALRYHLGPFMFIADSSWLPKYSETNFYRKLFYLNFKDVPGNAG